MYGHTNAQMQLGAIEIGQNWKTGNKMRERLVQSPYAPPPFGPLAPYPEHARVGQIGGVNRTIAPRRRVLSRRAPEIYVWPGQAALRACICTQPSKHKRCPPDAVAGPRLQHRLNATGPGSGRDSDGMHLIPHHVPALPAAGSPHPSGQVELTTGRVPRKRAQHCLAIISQP